MSAGQGELEITEEQKSRIQTLATALKIAEGKDSTTSPEKKTPAPDKCSYEFFSIEPKAHYEYKDLKALADKLPKDRASIMLRADEAKTGDILAPGQTYKNPDNTASNKESYSIRSNSPASRIIFYTANDDQKKEARKPPQVIPLSYYDLSTAIEMKVDDEKPMSAEQVQQIAFAHSQINTRDN